MLDWLADCAADVLANIEDRAASIDAPFVFEDFCAVVEMCVCVNDSPMMVTVYTSAGGAENEKTSKGEEHSQSS